MTSKELNDEPYEMKILCTGSSMSWRSKLIWIEFIVRSRKISNFCWAFILFLDSLGFVLVGTSSYFGKNLIS